ncbi:hypothetical protein ACFYZE_33530 [Streptomyces sp. NPDC001796]|uniref:hypothetical protein n=1 Tax=Streptomyces sp. NPDC001796 TaxID=3364609 RepID=UPI00368A1E16
MAGTTGPTCRRCFIRRPLAHDGRIVVTHHERLSGRGESRLVLDHYLDAFLRKPGAFPGSTAPEQAKDAGKFTPSIKLGRPWRALPTTRRASTRALMEVLLRRRMEHEHVVAGLASAHGAAAPTADAVVLEARQAAEGETFTEPAKPVSARPVQPQEETGGTVTPSCPTGSRTARPRPGRSRRWPLRPASETARPHGLRESGIMTRKRGWPKKPPPPRSTRHAACARCRTSVSNSPTSAIVDRLTFNGAIVQTGTASYRLAHIEAQAERVDAS